MCGGAIISDFIPVNPRSRRLTSDLLWADTKKSSKPKRSEIVDLDDEFEADFQEFKDESDVDDLDIDVDDLLLDVKPFAFSASLKSTSGLSHGNPPTISHEYLYFYIYM